MIRSVLFGAVTVGCASPPSPQAVTARKAAPPATTAPEVNPHVVPSPVSSSSARSGDISVPSEPKPPVRNAAPVNLLQVANVQIAVSSAVRNPRDYPEFLVDGQLETAWQSDTGDLVGGFIAFRLPADARVTLLEMTAGHSRKTDKIDLFTSNHRITKVEVVHDGSSLGLFTLDPTIRKPQALNVTGGGGEYRIIVKGVVAGTKRNWRELAVSELRVLGDPGKDLRPHDQAVRVLVGGFDAAAPEDVPQAWTRELESDHQPYLSPDAFCNESTKRDAAMAKELLEYASGMGIQSIDKPSCRVTEERFPLSAATPRNEFAVVITFDGLTRQKTLLWKRDEGWVHLPVNWSIDDPLDPGCPSFFRPNSIAAPRIENGHLVIVLHGPQQIISEEEAKRKTRTEIHGAVWCKLQAIPLACQRYLPEMAPSLENFSVAPDGTLRVQGRGL